MSLPQDPLDELEPLDPSIEQALADALRAAWAPGALAAATNERLITMALEDPFAEPSEQELIESERLRRALEGHGDHPDADLARALAAAARPEPAPRARLEPLERTALRPKRSNVVFVVFGAAAAAAALAASLTLVLRPAEERASVAARAAAPELEVSRSTSALFSERFAPGQATERIDRIATARERDLRKNLFTGWGVGR